MDHRLAAFFADLARGFGEILHLSGKLVMAEPMTARYTTIEFLISDPYQIEKILNEIDSSVYRHSRDSNGIAFSYRKDTRCRHCEHFVPEKGCTKKYIVNVFSTEGLREEEKSWAEEEAEEMADYASGDSNCRMFSFATILFD